MSKNAIMNKDEVWEQIKNDKSEIYGRPMLDVFLQVADQLSEPHFFELNKEQRNKLSGDVIYSLLYYATNIKKIADLIGQNINKLSEQHVYELLKKDKSEITNAGYSAMQKASSRGISYDVGSAASTEFASKYLRKDAILEYKNTNNDRDIYALLSIHSNNINNMSDLNKIIEKIGEEKLNYLSPISISKLLKDFSHLDRTGDCFEFFANKLGSNIEKIPDDSVVELIPTFQGGVGNTWTMELNRIEKIMKALGEHNLNKLNDKAIKHLLTYGPIKFREKIASVLGDLRNKLSDDSISALVDEAMRSPSSSSKIIDLIGEERFKKWFKSSEGQKEIEEWKRVIDLQDKKQHTQKNIDLFKQNLESIYQKLGHSNE